MRLKCFLRPCLLLAGALLITPSAPSADPAAPPAPPAPKSGEASTSSSAESEIDMLVRHAMPTAHHHLLDRMAGAWDTLTRYCPKPGAEPVESTGACTRKWILDGRFLMEELDGGNLALPFRGLGLFGYDAFEQKYTSAWVDTMNTSILTNLGTHDKTNEVVNFTGQYKDPWTGSKKMERGVIRFIGKDRHTLELFLTEPDGKEFKMLEIAYTRKPSGAPQ